MKNTIALAAVILGGALLYSGLTGKAPSNVLRMALGQEELPGINLPLDGNGVTGVAHADPSAIPPSGYKWDFSSDPVHLVPIDPANPDTPPIPLDDPRNDAGKK